MPPFLTRWEISTPGMVLGTPAIAGDTLFAATDAGFAISLDTDSGETLWMRDIGSPSDSAPAVAGDLVYLGTRDHRMLALDRITGELSWEHDLENIVLGSPIVLDGTLYIGSTNGKLEALDAATGDLRWSADANGWVVAHPATDGMVVAATSLGERFITVDPDTGRRRLEFHAGTPVAGGPVIADGRAFFVTNRGGVWAVDPLAVSRPFSRFAYVAKFNFFAWRLRSESAATDGHPVGRFGARQGQVQPCLCRWQPVRGQRIFQGDRVQWRRRIDRLGITTRRRVGGGAGGRGRHVGSGHR